MSNRQTFDLKTPANDIEDLVLLGDHVFSVAVPLNAPLRFKQYVVAAMKTYLAGEASIDRMYKKYKDVWNFRERTEDENTFFDTLSLIKRDVNSVVAQLTGPKQRPDHLGLFAAEAALIRLQTSFRTAILLIKQGFLFESAAILRLILEQIAWVHGVHKINDNTLFKVQANKTITTLKSFFPSGGDLYGILSELSHIKPNMTIYYIHFSDKNISINMNNLEATDAMIYALLILADLYRIIAEHVSNEYMDELLASEKQSDGSIHLKNDRPLTNLIELYKNKLLTSTSKA
jgi:hypothetical protein